MKNFKIIFMIFLMFLLITNPTLAVDGKYKDVPPTHWAFNAIQSLSQAGVVKGFPDNSFKPENKATREQFAIIFVKYFNFKLNDKACRTFWDINYNHRSFQYIDAAKSFIPVHYKVGLLFDFDPNKPITWEDAAHAIVKALELTKAQKPDKNYLALRFKDYQTISPELRESAGLAAYYGIFSGDTGGNFRGKAGLSRAELSVIFNNLIQRESIIKEGFNPVRKPWTIHFVNFKRPDYDMIRDFPDYNKIQSFYGKITSKVAGFNNSHFTVTTQGAKSKKGSLDGEDKTVYVYVNDKDLTLFNEGDWVYVYYDRNNNVTSLEQDKTKNR